MRILRRQFGRSIPKSFQHDEDALAGHCRPGKGHASGIPLLLADRVVFASAQLSVEAAQSCDFAVNGKGSVNANRPDLAGNDVFAVFNTADFAGIGKTLDFVFLATEKPGSLENPRAKLLSVRTASKVPESYRGGCQQIFRSSLP